jgi:hypothetical protein
MYFQGHSFVSHLNFDRKRYITFERFTDLSNAFMPDIVVEI